MLLSAICGWVPLGDRIFPGCLDLFRKVGKVIGRENLKNLEKYIEVTWGTSQIVEVGSDEQYFPCP